MRATVEKYEVTNPRWKQPAIRYKGSIIAFCCDDARMEAKYIRVSKGHGAPEITLGTEYKCYECNGGTWPILFCPWCGVRNEIEVK